ncbi:ABC transporter permease [Taklimakanibacter deserti]|uniref:ABC transporter permease n=1 Tax=Taklimakanibacter deserti TaxID=2267839 RepID=UPI000E65CDF6
MQATLKKWLGADSAAAVIALVAVLVVFSLVSPHFLTFINIQNIVVRAAILAVTGLGMTLIISMRALDLSVGSVMGFAAIVAAELLVRGVAMPLVVLAGLAAGGLLGLLNGLLITLLKIPSFVATLATLSMIFGIELLITDGQTVSIHTPLLNRIVVGNMFGVIPGAVVIALIVFAATWLIFYRTPFGRHVAAIGGDLKSAVGAGINVRLVTTGAFVLVGLCAALSGLMTAAQLQNVNSTIGVGAELTAIAVVVVGGTSLSGGRGNLFGTLCAALLLSAIKSGLNIANVSPLWEDLVFGGILIVALIVDGLRRETGRKGMLAL